MQMVWRQSPRSNPEGPEGAPEMTKSTFGEHLKREREMRGVSLDEISAATRIGTRFLEALENEQWDRLPGGVFNRGFVRAVARFLGLDEESLVAEYALATNDRPAPVWAAESTAQGSGTQWLPWLLALLGVALAAGGWFAWHRYAAARATRKAASPAGPAQATYQSFGTSPGRAANVPQGIAPAASAPGASGQAAPLPAGAMLPPAEPATLTLRIEAGKTTVVRVIADGKSVFDRRITAGRSRRFQAQEKFEISARNANALLLELNGQTLAPLGPPGKPGKVTLTRKDLKKASGGPD